MDSTPTSRASNVPERDQATLYLYDLDGAPLASVAYPRGAYLPEYLKIEGDERVFLRDHGGEYFQVQVPTVSPDLVAWGREDPRRPLRYTGLIETTREEWGGLVDANGVATSTGALARRIHYIVGELLAGRSNVGHVTLTWERDTQKQPPILITISQEPEEAP